jgi:hypothetical protein
VLSCLLMCSGIVTVLLRCIPNNKIFDPLYFKVTSVIVTSRIYKGYISYRNDENIN